MKRNLDKIPQSFKILTNEIFEEIEKHLGISRKQLLSQRRDHEIVAARYMAMQLMDMSLDSTLGTIAGLIGRDHSTVVHGLKEHKKLYEENYRNYTHKFDRIRMRFKKRELTLIDAINIVSQKQEIILEEIKFMSTSIRNLEYEIKKQNQVESNNNKGIPERGLLPLKDQGNILGEKR